MYILSAFHLLTLLSISANQWRNIPQPYESSVNRYNRVPQKGHLQIVPHKKLLQEVAIRDITPAIKEVPKENNTLENVVTEEKEKDIEINPETTKEPSYQTDDTIAKQSLLENLKNKLPFVSPQSAIKNEPVVSDYEDMKRANDTERTTEASPEPVAQRNQTNTKQRSLWENLRNRMPFVGSKSVLKNETGIAIDAVMSKRNNQPENSIIPLAEDDVPDEPLAKPSSWTTFKRWVLPRPPLPLETNAVLASLFCKIIYWPNELMLEVLSDIQQQRRLGERTASELLDGLEFTEASFVQVHEGSIRCLTIASTRRRQIHVVFEGTAKWEHWLTNIIGSLPTLYQRLNGEYVKNTKIHAGFQNSWHAIRNATFANIIRLRAKYPTYEILLSGHSLGAAVAELARLDIMEDIINKHVEKWTQEATVSAALKNVDYKITRMWLPTLNSTGLQLPKLPASVNIQLITFGAPKVGNGAYNKMTDKWASKWKQLHMSGIDSTPWERAKNAAYSAYYEKNSYAHEAIGLVARYKNIDDRVCHSPWTSDYENPSQVIWLNQTHQPRMQQVLAKYIGNTNMTSLPVYYRPPLVLPHFKYYWLEK